MVGLEQDIGPLLASTALITAVVGAVVLPPPPVGGGEPPAEVGIQFERREAYHVLMVAELFELVRSSLDAAAAFSAYYFPTFDQEPSAQQYAHCLAAEGIEVGMVRPQTVFPFPEKAVAEAAKKPSCTHVLSIEMSMGQMLEDVRLACEGTREIEFHGAAGGVVPSPDEVAAKIRALLP